MKKPDMWQIRQPFAHILCLALVIRITWGLDGSEFSGGFLTGPLLSMADFGIVLFVLALVASFLIPRVSAAVGLAAALLCIPLYLFFLAPIPFSNIFAPGHEFSVQPTPGFHWGKWTVAGLLALSLTSVLCVRRVAARGAIGTNQPATSVT